MKRFLAFSLSLCFLLNAPAHADTQSPRPGFNESDLPALLKPWSKWVLADYKPNPCPFLYNNATQKSCIWPGDLTLKFDATGGEFLLKATLFDEGWLPLPGSESRWPQRVKLGGQSLIVSSHDGHPSVFLAPGAYAISGGFNWNEMPENLLLPPATGIVHLNIAGQNLPFPSIDENATLWVKRNESVGTEAERMDIKVFRHVTDSVPTRIDTRIILHISGKPREILLGNTLIEGFIPLNVESPIPARIEPDGKLRLQVRPGTWALTIASHNNGAANELSLPAPSQTSDSIAMPKEEIWVFESTNYLRLVQLEGASPIDPAQTELPTEWRNLPAYYMQPSTLLKLAEKKRGNAEPAPDELSMSKELWLDFDGNGYTMRDHINGTVTQSWRLEMLPGIDLGRASIHDRDQFITRLGKDTPPGIEIRPGSLDLESDSRIENARSTLPATGWAHDMRHLSTTLHLPAGWSVLHASGADSISDSWVQRWTLLDVFMLVIAMVAIQRLFGLRTAFIATPGLILLQHALSPITGLTLIIVAAIALLRVLPKGRFFTLITFVRRAALLVLIAIALPFMVQHMRIALFPQLDSYFPNYGTNTAVKPNAMLTAAKAPRQVPGRYAADGKAEATSNSLLAVPKFSSAISASDQEEQSDTTSTPPQDIYQYDPNMHSNTGFGVASWQGNTVLLNWNGPVLANQSLQLWLLSPFVNLILAILRITLLGYIILVLLGIRMEKDTFKNLPSTAVKAFALALTLWLSPLSPHNANADDTIPSAPLLEEMKRKLIAEQEKLPACLPDCANISHAIIEATGDQLALTLEVHATTNIMLPLPGPMASWRPTDVTLDQGGMTAPLKSDKDGYLYAYVERGVHILHLHGPLSISQDSVNLTFPLKAQYLQINATGWNIKGQQPDGSYNGSLQFFPTGTRTKTEETTLEKNHFPALVEIERTISFGLSWQVETTLRRLSPLGESIALEIPLLDGETVTSDIPIKNHKAYISLAPQAESRSWISQLTPNDMLTLTASQSTDWPQFISGNEIWRLNISNLWHVTFDGIPSVLMPQSSSSNYTNSGEAIQMPAFVPRPGETLTLHITRPEAVTGQTLTIDHSSVSISAGSNAMEGTLDLTLRASQGGQHIITLPPGAVLSSAILNGATTSLSAKDNDVTLPLSPGSQTFRIVWNQPASMQIAYSIPPINLHIPSVNAESSLTLPHDRWIIWTRGPQMGPAVLFWGWIPIVFLVSLVLGQATFTPLRFHHWLLLLLGLTQTDLPNTIIIAGWFLALGLRAQMPASDAKSSVFNFRQIILACWTFAALSALFNGIKRGLLGSPDMRIQGNQSSNYLLQWYQDIALPLLPQPSVLSLPVFCYRGLMLLWALWLAFALLAWLKWAWQCFSTGGYWQRGRPWRTKPPTA